MKVSIMRQEDAKGTSLIHAIATEGNDEGRRFLYGWPDGKPRDGYYPRCLSEVEADRLENTIHSNGGKIDVSKPCWYECDPVYGSMAYQLSGLELSWVEREKSDDLAGF